MKNKKGPNYGKMFQEVKEYGSKALSYIPGSHKKNKVTTPKIYVCPRCGSTDNKINEGKQFVCNGCFLVMKVK